MTQENTEFSVLDTELTQHIPSKAQDVQMMLTAVTNWSNAGWINSAAVEPLSMMVPPLLFEMAKFEGSETFTPFTAMFSMTTL
jgi:hypothetical protein